jgi:branched-chain amino acid transport system ATP-binding protein
MERHGDSGQTLESLGYVLETVGLTKYFGMVRAAEEVSIAVRPGEFIGIIGPNGSGKTTFLNLVTGYVRPDQGKILYNGRDITGLPPRVVAEMGIARSFQMPQLYYSLSVLENMLLALAVRDGKGTQFWGPLRRGAWMEEARLRLAQLGLQEYDDHRADQLPEGARKLLDVALSLARRPRLLLMDEPTSGVSAREKTSIMDTLVRVLKQEGTTAIFVEHDMDIIERYPDRVLVFNEGKVIGDGPPDAVLADPVIRSSVLGRS